MEVYFSFPDTNFPTLKFEVNETSVTEDVLKEASKEWDIDLDGLQLMFVSEVLPSDQNLLSIGISAESELQVIREKQIFCKEDFQIGDFDNLFKSNPNKLCLIDASTFTDDDGVLIITLPQIINRIAFTKTEGVTRIGPKFLYHSNVQSISLEGFENVTYVGRSFLCGCNRLLGIDLAPLHNVKKIKSFFLCGCSLLKSLDTTPFGNLESLGNSFLHGCTKLQSISFPTTLPQIARIGSEFLCSCSSLQSIDLSSLINVTEINYSFLESCSTLTTVDLTPLSNVTDIGNLFLSDCSSLVSLSLGGLTSVDRIGNSFLKNCLSLTVLDLSPLVQIPRISVSVVGFLEGCPACPPNVRQFLMITRWLFLVSHKSQ